MGGVGWPSAAFAIRTIRILRRFQENKNQPRFFWFVFSSMKTKFHEYQQ